MKCIFSILDGVTSGPENRTGEIGKRLGKDHESNFIGNFTVIKVDLPNLSQKDVSTFNKDAKVFWYFLQVITIHGVFSVFCC